MYKKNKYQNLNKLILFHKTEKGHEVRQVASKF